MDALDEGVFEALSEDSEGGISAEQAVNMARQHKTIKSKKRDFLIFMNTAPYQVILRGFIFMGHYCAYYS
ncbi:MAG: hypothetical protein FWG14_04815 [Peptococcaceae bacterium]|nr:hypothetical protein [Peptococcaceae bacterium]